MNSTQRARPVVAIDGPAGVGKSTVSQRLAQALGFSLIETGAIYRAVALVARERGVAWDDAPALVPIAAALPIRFRFEAGANRVFLDTRDVTAALRDESISAGASQVSAHPEVRAALLDLQRRLGASGGVVLEGRDIGTVVFPDAEVKVFLTARPEVRAERRRLQLLAEGRKADAAAILDGLQARDHADSTRKVAPLAQAADAVAVDTSELSEDAVVAALRERVGAVWRSLSGARDSVS